MSNQTHTPEQVEWLCDKHVPELVNDIMYAMLAAKPSDIHLYLAKWAVDRLDEAQRSEFLRHIGIRGQVAADFNRRLWSSGLSNQPSKPGATRIPRRAPTAAITAAAATRALVPAETPQGFDRATSLDRRRRSLTLSFSNVFNRLPDYEQTMVELYYAHTQRNILWHNLERYLRSGDVLALDTLQLLEVYEIFFSYPGPVLMNQLNTIIEGHFSNAHARAEALEVVLQVVEQLTKPPRLHETRRFDILVVGGNDINEEVWRHEMERAKPVDSDLQFGLVLVNTFAEALVALLMNSSIQTVIAVDEVLPLVDFEAYYTSTICAYQYLVQRPLQHAREAKPHEVLSHLIGAIKAIRGEVDIFVLSERPVYDSELSSYVRRVFCAVDDFYGELTAALLGYINKRRHTPFFHALTSYAARPIGVFHAMAISRGSSVLKSNWCGEFLQFYGLNIFRAESSATCGGLDSLLDPTGSIKQAQTLAAEAYGSLSTFFVTNGTSTANKIVLQALLAPNDICVLDRDCHKSHHYGIIMTGALPAYLDAYPLHEYAMYGAVSLRDIKRKLLDYKRCGLIDKVKLLVLTNCTFDGIVYNVLSVMEQCLAIKPDLIFLWDEAWFAYAGFHPILKSRTGMGAAERLAQLLQSQSYQQQCKDFWAKHGALFDSSSPADHEKLLDLQLYPKPKDTVVRCYVTQSTHKSLTAFRQGSMIHVFDQRFGGTKNAFNEAYYTHTSTSPNYQILASLDVGRAQMQLEGSEFVMDMLAHAMYLRHHVGSCKHLTKWIKFLDVEDLIPAEFRKSHGQNMFSSSLGQITRFEDGWLSRDEFVLDPTRLTLFTGTTGVNGNDFKVEWLMNKYDIQVNKTSRNSVLFQTNIGTSFSSATFLLQALRKMVMEFDKQHTACGGCLSPEWQAQVDSLTKNHASLPDFTAFHDAFRPKGTLGNEGSMRDAFYLAFDEANCEYLPVTEARRRVEVEHQVLTGTTFIIPYPPGFPIIMPGQIISVGILDFMQKLDVKEIHGYHALQGLRVFKQSVLAAHQSFK